MLQGAHAPLRAGVRVRWAGRDNPDERRYALPEAAGCIAGRKSKLGMEL
jgi:hypothetical protein